MDSYALQLSTNAIFSTPSHWYWPAVPFSFVNYCGDDRRHQVVLYMPLLVARTVGELGIGRGDQDISASCGVDNGTEPVANMQFKIDPTKCTVTNEQVCVCVCVCVCVFGGED